MDALHGGLTLLRVQCDGIGPNGGLVIEISTTFDVVPGSVEGGPVVSRSHWPCKDCRTVEAHIFTGLVKHDYSLSKEWDQKELRTA